jgi:serine protease AprX
MKKYLILILLAVFFQQSHAQLTRYIVRFKDKQFNSYSVNNPSQFLSQRALDRRTKYNIPIDSTDLPVTARYIDSLRLAGSVTILNISKWLNQVAIKTSDAVALAKINSFAFVVSSTAEASVMDVPKENKKLLPFDSSPARTNGMEPVTSSLEGLGYGYSNGQVKIHQGDFLHNHGFRGEGMQLAMLDAGFYHYQTLPTFDSIRTNNQILGTWNFVNNNSNVNDGNAHGMECLSTIAANIPGTFIGTSPKTSFYLFVTEDDASESRIEEQNWAAGLEKADSLGVNVCSTSLGYNQFDNAAVNYTYADMNGHTTISARAGNIASQKGMLLVVAAGNEGTNAWHYIITPADADSVLAVGAVDTTGFVASFSSYGPSSDGDIKPAVASVGLNSIVANPSNGLPAYSSGTSFACPNMAGLVSCLWQAYPEINGRGIINAIEASANKSTAPDNRVGYGIPDMKKAFVILFKKIFTQQIEINNCEVAFNFSSKIDNSIAVVLERKTASENVYSTVKIYNSNSSFARQDFSFNDNLQNENFGNISYRIKVAIGNDTTFYIDPLVVNYAQQCAAAENKITVTPNPVTDYLNILMDRTVDAKASVIIQNISGQKVYAANFSLVAGTNSQKISMQPYSKGAYFVTIFIDGKKAITKNIIKQ